MNDTGIRHGHADFDFLFGRWNVRNRMLQKRANGEKYWAEFDAVAVERPLLGGLANLEQWDAEHGPKGPIHAIAVRLYDAATQTWRIHWSTAGSGAFGEPTSGRFEDGVGTFFDREIYEGVPIVVRFIWTQSDGDTCRWEQAFSYDDGATWETNWIMDFARASEEAAALSATGA